MVASNWVNLRGETVGQKYRIGELITASGQDAWFKAEDVSATGPEHVVLAATTRIVRNPIRLEELHHPNLRHVYASGIERVAGVEVSYVVVENVGSHLDGVLRAGPLDPVAARSLATDLVSALDHLHGRGLVYRGLRPQTIAQGEEGWVLADYSLLIREGSVEPAETRLLIASSPHVPPDAYYGIVSPAWDLWSLGVTLNQALAGEGGRGDRRHKPRPAPPPFDALIRGCLEPDPNNRIRLRDAARLLGIELTGRADLTAPVLSPRLRERPVLAEAVVPPPAVQPQPISVAPQAIEAPPQRIEKESRMDAERKSPPARPSDSASRAGRRKSRVYSAPIPQQPQYPDESSLRRAAFRWSSLDPQARMWLTVAFVVLALLTGALLAMRGDQGSRAQAVERSGADRTSPSRPPAPRPTEPVPSPPPLSPEAEARERRSAIYAMLDEWLTTTRELDLEKHVNTYAPVVDTFFRKRGVPLAEVRKEKQRFFKGISEVRQLKIDDIRIESFRPDRAVVSFKKDWDMRGPRPSAGSERERLTLRWIDGNWRIAGEQELKIYWTRK